MRLDYLRAHLHELVDFIKGFRVVVLVDLWIPSSLLLLADLLLRFTLLLVFVVHGLLLGAWVECVRARLVQPLLDRIKSIVVRIRRLELASASEIKDSFSAWGVSLLLD